MVIRKMKDRLDNLMVARGLADNLEQSRRLMLAGNVRVAGQVATKAGYRYAMDVVIEVATRPRFVSRGGDKLEGAFTAFDLNVMGLDCLDVGASTGGFTDCLLQHGAARVIALDVGHAQIHERISQDQRVTVIEGFNARYLKITDLPYPPHFAVADVSFISLRLILPKLIEVLPLGGGLVTLIKPQFEAARAQAPEGVVCDQAVRQEVVESIKAFGTADGRLAWQGVIASPLIGPAGNVEFLAYWKKTA